MKKDSPKSQFKARASKKKTRGLWITPFSALLSSHTAMSAFFVADLASGGTMTVMSLGLMASYMKIKKEDIHHNKTPTEWTTDSQQIASGTYFQKKVYRAAQNEIYRLEGLKTDQNAFKVNKEVKAIQKKALKVFKNVKISQNTDKAQTSRYITFLASKPPAKRKLAPRFKI